MKNKKICPKCNSEEILCVPGSAGAYGSGNNIFIGATTMSAIKVPRYICCNCGYAEEWIDLEDIPKLIKKFG